MALSYAAQQIMSLFREKSDDQCVLTLFFSIYTAVYLHDVVVYLKLTGIFRAEISNLFWKNINKSLCNFTSSLYMIFFDVKFLSFTYCS